MTDAQVPVDGYMGASFPSSVLFQRSSAGKFN